jgi:uncharacterized membrane protein
MSGKGRGQRALKGVGGQVTHGMAASFSGPIPPPNMLEAYSHVIPDLPERLVSMMEGEQKHRQTSESRLIGLEEKRMRGTFILAFVGMMGSSLITLGLIGLSAWMLYIGKTAGGAATLISALGLAASQIGGRAKRKPAQH